MAEFKEPYYVLGLDPGIASCGFCLLDTANHTIPEMGAHLFDVPQTDKTKTSHAAVRRNARSSRRNNDRTQDRQNHCLRLLKENGLVPDEADKTWLQSKKGDKPLLKLRARGLDTPLSARAFAQILYSLSGRRGYIPHGMGDGSDADKKEDGKVLQAIQSNSKLMQEKGYRTIGEWLHAQGKSRNKAGDYSLCVLNSQLADEAKQLFAAQRTLGQSWATLAFEEAYISCMQWEKKTLEQDERTYQLVGACTYLSSERRAANATISSELCRAYERLSHLVVVHADATEQILTHAQKERYLSILFSPLPIKNNKDCKVTYSRIRKDLDLSATSFFKGIPEEEEGKEEPFVPKAWRLMRKSGVRSSLLEQMLEDHTFGNAIGEALTYASTEESLQCQLEPLALSQPEVEEICALPFSGKVFKGYGSRSLKALELLIDAFEDEDVRTLADAEAASGLATLRRQDKMERTGLLPPYVAYDSTCTNPVVLRAMARMRRIVTAICKRYGVPHEIHIELGRDLKHSNKEKKRIRLANAANKKENDKCRKDAADLLGCDPADVTGKQLLKCRLREEQGGKDAYTDQTIDRQRMLEQEYYTEIDHILPYSRTCDDSRANKVLVLATNNQNKKERTPYEWMTQDAGKGAPDWESFKGRTLARVKDWKKRDKLLNTSLADGNNEAEFIARNLNDTRYMSRAVKEYLEDSLLFPDNGKTQHVWAVAGGATASLRHVWELNFGAHSQKDRSDDRHHAVDAAVIAACDYSTVIKVAKARALGPNTFKVVKSDRLKETQPWESFTADVLAKAEKIVPTRMVSHSVTGRAFEETLYRFDGVVDDEKRYGLLTAKKKTSKQGNYVIDQQGAAHLVDGLAFLRLWADPDARPTGKVKGRWYAEPVFYADIPFIQNGTYVPRAITIQRPRTDWAPVPASAMAVPPVILFPKDAVEVDGHFGRFCGVNISSCKWIMKDLLTKEELTGFPTIAKLGRDSVVRVIQEDVLGHCYRHLNEREEAEETKG